ncbi:MGT family glycosyltransferase [Tamaricihabitans halophyticus]|uniref:MGT family glycosyltransferase n=1 Tax=Tamaricihabitans halophyticus TaxID=1262583 RepID=A0A4R2QIB0_9PSEU|nr:nucleotide disphospho-sugar-binding domain-containing protein [Tamaricihabitans halophyticus]TCP48509.1 MGT family glycosyltransferase [Tamaricihabitans halophyticus]
MADYLFLPYLAHGHVNPMMPVAAELARRGNRVTVAVSERFTSQVTAAGATALPIPGHEVRVPAGYSLSELGERGRVLLARWGAWAAAIRTVLRYLRAHRSDAVLADVRLPWAGTLVGWTRSALVWLSTTHLGGSRRRPVLVNMPPTLESTRRSPDRARFITPLVRSAAVAGSAGGERLDARPLVLVSPGTVFARSPDFFRRVAREFANSPWQVLMATGATPVSDIGALPPNVLARDWLPQRALLRHTAVLVGHGGMNSVQEALLAGVPMVLCPRSREQKWTTHRLVDLGVAVRANDAVRLQVEQVADDERMRARCQAMRAQLLAEPGAALAADVLTEVARRDVPNRSRRATMNDSVRGDNRKQR